MKQKKGIELVELNDNLCKAYFNESEETLQEIGDEVVQFSGNTAEELAKSIRAVLKLAKKQRLQLVKKALAWEQQFTWEKTAQKTIEVYKKVI